MPDSPGLVDRRIVLELTFSDHELERLAERVAELLAGELGGSPWLDVPCAARHLALTEHALRGLVKQRRIPFHRTENGRLRFAVTELDHWVRTGSCEPTNEDLP